MFWVHHGTQTRDLAIVLGRVSRLLFCHFAAIDSATELASVVNFAACTCCLCMFVFVRVLTVHYKPVRTDRGQLCVCLPCTSFTCYYCVGAFEVRLHSVLVISLCHLLLSVFLPCEHILYTAGSCVSCLARRNAKTGPFILFLLSFLMFHFRRKEEEEKNQ